MSGSDFLYRHKIISALLVIWLMAIVSFVVYQVFSCDAIEISGQTAALASTVFGFPALAIGLWKWRNKKPAENEE